MRSNPYLTVMACAVPMVIAYGSETNAQEEVTAPQDYTVDFDAGISVGAQHTDNLFLTSNDKRSDFAVTLSPWVDLTVQSQDYVLSFGANSEIARFSDYSSEDYEDVAIGAEARYRLSQSVFLFGGLEYRWDHEDRSSPDDVNGLEPTDLTDASGYFGIGGRLDDRSFRIGVNIRDLDFDDTPTFGGFDINNDDRDRQQTEFGGRIGVATTENGEVFLQGIYDQREYDDSTDDAGFERSSEGFQASIGYTGRIGDLTGEVMIGALRQNYEDDRFETVTEPIFGANLDWRASENTRITGILERTLEETTLRDASGYLSSTAGIRVRHDVAQDLSASAYYFLTQNDYQGVDRKDNISEAGLGLRYYFNPKLYLDADYEFLQRLSDVAGAEYDEHRLLVSVGTSLQAQYEPEPDGTASPDAGAFYVGAQVGTGVLQSKVDGPRGNGGSLTADFGDNGTVGGVFAGYRTNFGNLLLGGEVEVEFGDLEWTHDANRDFSVKSNDAYSLSGLAGLRTQADNLIYGRFGITSAEFESRYERRGNRSVVEERETGYSVGIGTEVPLDRGLSARMEYVLRSFEDYDIGAVLGGDDDDNFANLQGLARFGLVYQFGASAVAATTANPVDFSGFYAGGQVGHGAIQSDNSGPRPTDAAREFTLSATRSGQGFSGSVIAGYGFQWGNLYFSPEVELGVSSASWDIERNPTGRIYSVEKSESLSAMLRLGYVVNDSTLIYGRAGVSNAKFKTSYDYRGESVDQDDTLHGVRLGAGVEFELRDNFHVRFDYTQTDYDSHKVDYGRGVDDFDTSENLFQVGLTYQF